MIALNTDFFFKVRDNKILLFCIDMKAQQAGKIEKLSAV